MCCLIGVARIQYGTPVYSSHHSNIFERHLRWTVLADAYTRMCTAQPNAYARHRRHPDLVEGSAEKSGERRGKCGLPQSAEADSGSDKLLLGDVYLSLIHISEPTRQAEISYAVFCLKKNNKKPRQ